MLVDLSQVPLISLTDILRKKTKSDRVGNFIFWVSFVVLGQPISVLLYLHDFMKVSECVCVCDRWWVGGQRVVANMAGPV